MNNSKRTIRCRACGAKCMTLSGGTLGECRNPVCRNNKRMFQEIAFRRMNKNRSRYA